MSHITFLCLSFPICNVSVVDDPKKSLLSKKVLFNTFMYSTHIYVNRLICARNCFRHWGHTQEQK